MWQTVDHYLQKKFLLLTELPFYGSEGEDENKILIALFYFFISRKFVKCAKVKIIKIFKILIFKNPKAEFLLPNLL
jgi:hypothetical protein